MKKLCAVDVLPVTEFESRRPAILQRIIQLKYSRRVALGDCLSLVFENRETVWFQVQEVLRGEFTEPDRVQEEIDSYNLLIPEVNELRATLFIELPDSHNMNHDLRPFVGVQNHVRLRFGAHLVRAEALGQPPPLAAGRIVTVHYLRLTLSAAQVQDFGRSAVCVEVELPPYRATTQLNKATIASLTADLADKG